MPRFLPQVWLLLWPFRMITSWWLNTFSHCACIPSMTPWQFCRCTWLYGEFGWNNIRVAGPLTVTILNTWKRHVLQYSPNKCLFFSSYCRSYDGALPSWYRPREWAKSVQPVGMVGTFIDICYIGLCSISSIHSTSVFSSILFSSVVLSSTLLWTVWGAFWRSIYPY